MFTIKHITLGDTETLYQNAKPRYEPKESNNGQIGRKCGLVTFIEGNEVIELTGGTVFIMNEQGKTVARYDLGASNVPLQAGVIGAHRVTISTSRPSEISDPFPCRA